MLWAGKALGGLLGYVAAGPFGSLFGIVLGHQFDEGLRQRRGASRGRASGETRERFFAATFSIMGHIAKSDGRVSEEEIRAARRIMHGMQLSPEQVMHAIDHFTRGKGPQFNLSNAVAELADELRGRRELVSSFIHIQLQALVASGGLDRSKRDLLWKVARELGMGRVELAQIEALVRAQHATASMGGRNRLELTDAYKVLGVGPDATPAQIKLAYRRLMSQHHPDKLVARGLPESMRANAELKTREIRAAYDRVKAERNLS